MNIGLSVIPLELELYAIVPLNDSAKRVVGREYKIDPSTETCGTLAIYEYIQYMKPPMFYRYFNLNFNF